MSIANLSESDRQELNRYVEDFVRYAVEVREFSEQAQAVGVPPVAFLRHVGMRVREDRPLQPALNEFRPVAEKRYGEGTFREDEVRELLEEAIRSQRECEHLKKVLRGYQVDQFAIEKYVEIRAHNPLDRGLSHLREIGLLAGSELVDAKSASVDPVAAQSTADQQKQVDQKESAVKARHQERMRMLVDVAIGLGIGASALLMLT